MEEQILENICNYVLENSITLFKTNPQNRLLAEFDTKGFFFSDIANEQHREIRLSPHLYVAYNSTHCYIGKSYQRGGRWRRSHAYHLGTLAHEVLGTTRYDDQNHAHWIDAWMNRKSINLETNPYTIELKEEVKIAFIPFQLYGADLNHEDIGLRNEIRDLNSQWERRLIAHCPNSKLKCRLLNVQGAH